MVEIKNRTRTTAVWLAGLVLLAALGIVVAAGSAVGPDAQAQAAPAMAASAALDDDFQIFLPLVVRAPDTTLPFQDDFNNGLSADWVVFENYPGLTKDDWYWDGEAPLWGFYVYNYDNGSGWENFVLSMYLGPGSQEWTDYEVVTTVKKTGAKDKLGGLWVRGTYEPSNDMSGGNVGGYYVHIKPQDDKVYLWRILPQDRQYQKAQVVAQGLYTPGIAKQWFNLKVRVEGARIRAWLKQEGAPDSSYVQLIDWTDPTGAYMKGTVGFSAWRTTYIWNDINVIPIQ
jgi:hypothetical protein